MFGGRSSEASLVTVSVSGLRAITLLCCAFLAITNLQQVTSMSLDRLGIDRNELQAERQSDNYKSGETDVVVDNRELAAVPAVGNTDVYVLLPSGPASVIENVDKNTIDGAGGNEEDSANVVEDDGDMIMMESQDAPAMQIVQAPQTVVDGDSSELTAKLEETQNNFEKEVDDSELKETQDKVVDDLKREQPVEEPVQNAQEDVVTNDPENEKRKAETFEENQSQEAISDLKEQEGEIEPLHISKDTVETAKENIPHNEEKEISFESDNSGLSAKQPESDFDNLPSPATSAEKVENESIFEFFPDAVEAAESESVQKYEQPADLVETLDKQTLAAEPAETADHSEPSFHVDQVEQIIDQANAKPETDTDKDTADEDLLLEENIKSDVIKEQLDEQGEEMKQVEHFTQNEQVVEADASAEKLDSLDANGNTVDDGDQKKVEPLSENIEEAVDTANDDKLHNVNELEKDIETENGNDQSSADQLTEPVENKITSPGERQQEEEETQASEIQDNEMALQESETEIKDLPVQAPVETVEEAEDSKIEQSEINEDYLDNLYQIQVSQEQQSALENEIPKEEDKEYDSNDKEVDNKQKGEPDNLEEVETANLEEVSSEAYQEEQSENENLEDIENKVPQIVLSHQSEDNEPSVETNNLSQEEDLLMPLETIPLVSNLEVVKETAEELQKEEDAVIETHEPLDMEQASPSDHQNDPLMETDTIIKEEDLSTPLETKPVVNDIEIMEETADEVQKEEKPVIEAHEPLDMELNASIDQQVKPEMEETQSEDISQPEEIVQSHSIEETPQSVVEEETNNLLPQASLADEIEEQKLTEQISEDNKNAESATNPEEAMEENKPVEIVGENENEPEDTQINSMLTTIVQVPNLMPAELPPRLPQLPEELQIETQQTQDESEEPTQVTNNAEDFTPTKDKNEEAAQESIEVASERPLNVADSGLNYVNASFMQQNNENQQGTQLQEEDDEMFSSQLRRYDGAQVWRIVVQTDKDRKMADELQTKYGGQLWKEVKQEIDYLLKPQVLAQAEQHIRAANLSRIVLIDNLQNVIEVENPPADQIALLQNRKGHRLSWQAYHRLEDIHGFFDYLAKTYPDICSVETIGYSIQKRPLKILKISNGNKGNPGIWIDGGMHAREWIGPASVTYIANQIVEGWDDLPAHMRNINWHIHAVANPDGYEYSHTTDRLWRKNLRSHGRQSCPGVDLNRNFGYKWGGKGTSANPCSQTYRGNKAFSEPETFYISKYISNFPRETFQAYLTFHSYGQYILYPWGYDYALTNDRADLDRVARQAGTSITRSTGGKYTVGSSAITLYPAAGGSDDWAKGIAGIKYAYTIEMGDTGRYGFVLPASHIEINGRDGYTFVETVANALTQGNKSRRRAF